MPVFTIIQPNGSRTEDTLEELQATLKQRALDVLSEDGGPMTTEQVAAALCLPIQQVAGALGALHSDGAVNRGRERGYGSGRAPMWLDGPRRHSGRSRNKS